MSFCSGPEDVSGGSTQALAIFPLKSGRSAVRPPPLTTSQLATYDAVTSANAGMGSGSPNAASSRWWPLATALSQALGHAGGTPDHLIRRDLRAHLRPAHMLLAC